MAKIETSEALTKVPDIIVAGASVVPLGVMIARGDLAMAIGYPRLAEMQEECLWVAKPPTCRSFGPRRCSNSS